MFEKLLKKWGSIISGSLPHRQGCKSLLSIGRIICNFTPILPYFQHWGDEPRPRFFSGEQIKWRPKKRSSPKMEHLFSPNSGEDQKKRSLPKMEHFYSPYAVEDQIKKINIKKRFSPKRNTFFPLNQVETCVHADENHTQIIGGIQ